MMKVRVSQVTWPQTIRSSKEEKSMLYISPGSQQIVSSGFSVQVLCISANNCAYITYTDLSINNSA